MSEPHWYDRLRQELEQAGVPLWAAGGNDVGQTRLYVWVDDDDQLQAALVGDANAAQVRILQANCDDEAWPWTSADGQPEASLTAFLVIRASGYAHGRKRRVTLRPLIELRQFARQQLERLSASGGTADEG